ncbi:MAG: hypothetical protein AAF629_12080 [Chloroflexota bacterium]
MNSENMTPKERFDQLAKAADQNAKEMVEVAGKNAYENVHGKMTTVYKGRVEGDLYEVLEGEGGAVHVLLYKRDPNKLDYAVVEDENGNLVEAQQGTLPYVNFVLWSFEKQGGQGVTAAQLIGDRGLDAVTFPIISPEFDENDELVNFNINYFNVG